MLKRLRRKIRGYRTFEYSGDCKVYHRSGETGDWSSEDFMSIIPLNLKGELERLYQNVYRKEQVRITREQGRGRKRNDKKLGALKKIIIEKYRDQDPVIELSRHGAKMELLEHAKTMNGFWENNYTSRTEASKVNLFNKDVNMVLKELRETGSLIYPK